MDLYRNHYQNALHHLEVKSTNLHNQKDFYLSLKEFRSFHQVHIKQKMHQLQAQQTQHLTELDQKYYQAKNLNLVLNY